MLPNIDPARHRLEVRAELAFAVREGKTRLRRSFAEPPLQVQRVLYRDDYVPDMAFLFLLNPTPGIFQGDLHSILVNAGPRTRVHLTTPSAAKIYAMPDRDARQKLTIELARDSYLEYCPEPTIPFRGARLRQRISVNVASGATLIIGDIVVPGRVASGESFAFHTLDRRLTVTGPTGLPIHHEASLLTPQSLSPLGRSVLSEDRPVTGTLLIVAPGHDTNELKKELRPSLSAKIPGSNGSRLGLSTLPDGAGLAVKILATESQFAKAITREIVATARHHFLEANPLSRQNR
ncbi:MAG: urease accessory protein UreD [Dehalococcoidia bacterium]